MTTSERRSGSAPAIAPSPSHHRADIQGLRGVAVLLVVLFHAGVQTPGGFIGVDVFFVISGFVITQLLWREMRSTHRLSVANFYSRRVRRILPALAVFVVTVAGLSALFENPLGTQRNTARAGIAAVTFYANQYLYSAKAASFGAAANSNPILHTWSLSVEEQFYLVFPITLLVATLAARRFFRGRDTTRSVVTVVGLGFVASFVLSYLTTHGKLQSVIHAPIQWAYYSAVTRAWEFAAGALVALLASKLSRIRRNEALIIGVLGLAMVLWSARVYTKTTPFPGSAAVVPVAGTVFMIVGGFGTTGGVTRLLSAKPIVWIGDLSYGWYLWHWPFMVFAALLFTSSAPLLSVAAIAALVPTYLSYRWVEQPIRLNSSFTGRKAAGLAAVCIGVPLVVCLALGVSADTISHSSLLHTVNQAVASHADEQRGCDRAQPITELPARCTWHAPNPGGAIWLVGDSNAGNFTEPAAAAATRDGYDLHVATNPECPFANLGLIENNNPVAGCGRFVTNTVTTLEQEQPRLVVLASDATTYVDSSQFQFRDPRTGEVARGASAKAAVWQAGLASVLRDFAAAKIPVVVIDSVPHFANWNLSTCPAIKVYLDLKACGTALSLTTVRVQQLLALYATAGAISKVTGAREVDFTAELCSATTCPTNLGDRFLYRDASQLTIATSVSLTPRFTALFKALASRST